VIAKLRELRDALGWPPASGNPDSWIADPETVPDDRVVTADATPVLVPESISDRTGAVPAP
jgi:hypothetical protein